MFTQAHARSHTHTHTHTSQREAGVWMCWQMEINEEEKKNLTIQIRLGFVAVKWAGQSFRWSSGEGERDVRNSLFSFYKDFTKPSHVSDSFPEGGGGAGGGGIPFSWREEGNCLPIPVYLVFRLLNTGCREQRRLKQWFNTWLLSHFISVISHTTPPHIPTTPSPIASSSTQEP